MTLTITHTIIQDIYNSSGILVESEWRLSGDLYPIIKNTKGIYITR